MAVWGGLTNSYEKKRSEKQRRKGQIYHFNAEFERIARRDKKAFLGNQCKEIEEINIIGETRDLFKKVRDVKGIVHAKMGSIKDRNFMDLTEGEKTTLPASWETYSQVRKQQLELDMEQQTSSK